MGLNRPQGQGLGRNSFSQQGVSLAWTCSGLVSAYIVLSAMSAAAVVQGYRIQDGVRGPRARLSRES